MENNTPSQPPFFINQRVVALKTLIGNKGVGIIKDEVYFVKGMIKHCKWSVDVGLVSKELGKTCCKICGELIQKRGNIVYVASYLLAPYNPPRHESVEIAEDILQMKIVEEIADTIVEKILN